MVDEVGGPAMLQFRDHAVGLAGWAARIHDLLARVDGIVFTHGTNAIEETAYYLRLTFVVGPVVVTGAMRSYSGPSTDGPLNLVQAVRLAASPGTVEFGVVIATNGDILDPALVTKVAHLPDGGLQRPACRSGEEARPTAVHAGEPGPCRHRWPAPTWTARATCPTW